MSDFSLFIIESLRFKDEERGCLEGRILRDALRMSRPGLEVEYLYLRTHRELIEAFQRFSDSRKRYLHISCHGNQREIALTLDRIPFDEFGTIVAPYINRRRLFFSACHVVNEDLAAAVMDGTGCYSLIGPRTKIAFGDAAMMWAAFYHLTFRDPAADGLNSTKIRRTLRRIHHAFGENFEYFTRSADGQRHKKVSVNR